MQSFIGDIKNITVCLVLEKFFPVLHKSINYGLSKVSVKYFATCIQSGSPRGEPDALLWDVDYLTHTLRLMTLTS